MAPGNSALQNPAQSSHPKSTLDKERKSNRTHRGKIAIFEEPKNLRATKTVGPGDFSLQRAE